MEFDDKRSNHERGERERRRGLVVGMLKGGSGPLLSFISMFAAPLVVAQTLPTDQFALWSILASVVTVSNAIDFGGASLLMARYDFDPRRSLLLRSAALSVYGSLGIGLIACLAFIPFSDTATGRATTLVGGMGAIALATMASAMRGVVVVIAQAALCEKRFLARTIMLSGQALVASGLMIALAFDTRSAWSLPLAWSASSCIALLGAVCWVGSQSARNVVVTLRSSPAGSLTVRYAVWRTVEGLLTAALLQADRWIVGSLATASFLAAYEIAWRVASMPKFLVQVMSSYLGTEGRRQTYAGDAELRVSAFLRQSSFILTIAALSSSVMMCVVYFALSRVAGYDVLTAVFFVLLIVLTFHGLSAPLSVIGLGLELPRLDIPYLAVGVGGSIVATLSAFYFENVSLYIFASNATLVGAIGWFFYYGPSAIRSSSRRLSLGEFN